MAKSKKDVKMTEHHKENKRMGKARRKDAPRAAHGDWEPATDRPDPITLLQAQDKDRIQHLVPIKYGPW